MTHSNGINSVVSDDYESWSWLIAMGYLTLITILARVDGVLNSIVMLVFIPFIFCLVKWIETFGKKFKKKDNSIPPKTKEATIL